MWIFLDTNIYLDFYRLRSVAKLLLSLQSVKDKIFLPEQVRNEVIRNRLKAALERIGEDDKKLSIEIVPFPDLLTQIALTSDHPSLEEEWTIFGNRSKELKKEYKSVLAKTARHIAEGVDPISQGLQEVFLNVRAHNDEQLKKARLRKELGHPPGKPNDPLGDQLAWEQLISTVEDTEDIWIVSRDSDYLITFHDEVILNPYLYEEFTRQRAGRVFTFNNLASALEHYKNYADSMLTLPPVEELDLAKREQQSFSKKATCKCSEGPTPLSTYENRFFVVRCGRCGTILAVQEDGSFLD